VQSRFPEYLATTATKAATKAATTTLSVYVLSTTHTKVLGIMVVPTMLWQASTCWFTNGLVGAMNTTLPSGNQR
jgi:hypothetical protein